MTQPMRDPANGISEGDRDMGPIARRSGAPYRGNPETAWHGYLVARSIPMWPSFPHGEIDSQRYEPGWPQSAGGTEIIPWL